MAIELTEEAFALLHGLREQLERAKELLATDAGRAQQELEAAIADLSDWIGPGVP